MTNYYIYETTNLINGKKYRGKRETNLPIESDTNYLGSGNAIRAAIRKYGKKNFSKIVLEVGTHANIFQLEAKWVNDEWLNMGRKHNYNLRTGGFGFTGIQCSEETKRKMAAWKRDSISEEHRCAISNLWNLNMNERKRKLKEAWERRRIKFGKVKKEKTPTPSMEQRKENLRNAWVKRKLRFA